MFQKLALLIIVVISTNGCLTAFIKNRIVQNTIQETQFEQAAFRYFHQGDAGQDMLLKLTSANLDEVEYATTCFGKAVLAILVGTATQPGTAEYKYLHGIAVALYNPDASATQNLLAAVYSQQVQQFARDRLRQQIDYRSMSDLDLDKVMAAAVTYCEIKIAENGEAGARQMLDLALPSLEQQGGGDE